MKTILQTLVLLGLLLVVACSNDTSSITTDDDIDEPGDPITTSEIEIYNPSLFHLGLVMAIENAGTQAYLINKEGQKLFTWNFDLELGNDLELLPNGQVLGIFKTEDPKIIFGGYGGIIRIINPDGSIDWEFEYSTDDYISHHDAELLPNGNILFIAWERIDVETAQQFGANADQDVFTEKLVEVNPDTNEIVWEWRSWEHIVQDEVNNLNNYGIISESPNRININYNLPDKIDLMHANGIDYDEEKDVIYMTVNAYSEIWVIDHSTTTAEASTSFGGNYNKGGDLLYRFGNPTAYNNTLGKRIFYSVHFPNLLENDEVYSGRLLTYSNGNNIQQSKVYEIQLPETFALTPNLNNEPEVIWDFTDPDLYSSIISGASRLSNGNTLICEGDYGYWEVTPDKEIAWKYNGEGTTKYWRGYDYDLDYVGLPFLGLTF